MESATLHDLIDQTGVETIFGATPAKLPRLSEAEQQTLRAGGLPALQQQGIVSVDAELSKVDPSLEQTRQILSAPTAVVRVYKHGLESGPVPKTRPGLFWAFVQGDHIVQLFVDTKQKGHYRLASLPDPTALFGEIEKLLPISWMPQKAHARAMVGKGDAEDIFDQSLGTGLNVAAELLVSDGLSDEEAQVAFDIMRTSTLAGRISFMVVGRNEVSLDLWCHGWPGWRRYLDGLRGAISIGWAGAGNGTERRLSSSARSRLVIPRIDLGQPG